MEVVVDPDRCQGHGKCYLAVPEVFEPCDDWGHARSILSVDPEDAELKRRVETAIEGCPERAISWKEQSDA